MRSQRFVVAISEELRQSIKLLCVKRGWLIQDFVDRVMTRAVETENRKLEKELTNA